jgi:uncharacterized protein YlzI (FlbEa/FlbD family)
MMEQYLYPINIYRYGNRIFINVKNIESIKEAHNHIVISMASGRKYRCVGNLVTMVEDIQSKLTSGI